MINKSTKKKLNNWNKTKNIYLDWISDNRLKRIFSREIIYEGLSLWWVNSLTFKDNMIDKSWYCDLNNILNYNIKPKSSNNQFFLIFIYLRMLKNFLRATFWSIIIKLFSNTRKLSHKAKNVFYCYNYNFFKRNFFEDRCYGNAPEKFKKDNLLLISIIKKGHFFKNLKNFKSLKNSSIISDEFISLKDIIIVYFFIFKKYLILKKILKNNKNLFILKKKNCEEILKDKLLSSFSGDIQNSILSGIAIQKSLKKINPKYFITYSKLSISRAIYFFLKKNYKNIKIINYQHGHCTSNILFDNHRSKEFSKKNFLNGINYSPAPDIFLTQGDQYNKIVKKFFKNKIYSIGCLKYDKLVFKNSFYEKDKIRKKTILVCPSIGDEDDLLQYFYKSKVKNIRLILSPHPTYKNETIKKFKKKLKDKFFIEIFNNKSTFELVQIADLVVCGFSSVAFEAGILGKKAIRALNLSNPIYNEYKDGVPFVFDQKKFDHKLKNIQKIKFNKSVVKKNIFNYFFKLDNSSSKRFWKILKK